MLTNSCYCHLHFCVLLIPANSAYYKTLNVSVPFISRAKLNREIEGHEYQL